MEILSLQGIGYDPRLQKISLPKPIGIKTLYLTTKEAFLHSNLISVVFPITVVEFLDQVVYVVTWEVFGEVLDEREEKLHKYVDASSFS